MYRCLLIFICLTIFSSSVGWTQNNRSPKYTISGYVKDNYSGENMIGATIYTAKDLTGTSTNQFGFYSITLDSGQHTIIVSYIGFLADTLEINLQKNLTHSVSLDRQVVTTETIEIVGEKANNNVESTEMGTVDMDMKQIEMLPALFGEVDILKTIQLLPGVQSGNEGSTGFYVRGGGPDQNLILLDGGVIYNPSHLFGFFSVFNSNAINNVKLIKGGMPAQYGGRLASVVDVTMNEGNNKRYEVDGGIGLISSRISVQGPIKKDTSSFMISGRRTYVDVLAKPFIPDDSRFSGSGYYFYDLNAKANYLLSEKDRIFFSGYIGRDIFTFENNEDDFKVRTPWGNTMASLRWNHLFSKKLFLNTSLIYTDYQFSFEANQDDFEFKLFSEIEDYSLNFDFSYFPNVRHDIKFGFSNIYHTFTPGHVSARTDDAEFDTGDLVKQYAYEGGLYFNDEYTVTDALSISAGIRYSLFGQYGPFDRFIKQDLSPETDTISYAAWEEVATYSGFEPRVSLKYSLNTSSSVKLGYTHNYQYLHLASLSSLSLPTDIWVPSSDVVKPQIGTQYAIGYFKNFKNNRYESSVEVYYKDMKNLVEYKEGALPEDNIANNPDNNFTFGTGYSYGVELFFKKRYGDLTGWVGYTWSKTNRKFDEINSGREFPAKYDRRHDLSIVGSYRWKRWVFSSTFVYGTGNAITLPVNRYLIEGNIVNEYGDRNSYRMAPYHRVDVSATLNSKSTRRFKSSWTFAIYNVYSRQNPYFIYLDTEGDLLEGTFDVAAKQVSLFPILPSVTWNFTI